MSFLKFKEKQDKVIDLKVVCDRCGKPAPGKGNITSWIFRDSRCQCESTATSKSAPAPSTGSANLESFAHEQMPDTGAEPTPSVEPESALLELGERYQVLSLLGQGGMGSVYKVRDKDLDQTFAIKVLHPDLAKDKAAARRFEQEAELAKDLTHPNLVAMYRHGVSASGAPYLVMDYIDGKTLAELLQEQVFIEPERATDIFLQVSEAVAHAHMKGVIHRDLKPSNIIVTATEGGGGELARVADFGIGKILAAPEAGAQALTQTGEVFGSPLYMSPEQGEGEKLDSRSDVYSLGCVMYESLTGKPPFSGANPIKTIMKHLMESPPAFPKQMNIPDALERVVMHCLEKDPALRYQSMQELLTDLERVRDGKAPLAHSPSHTLVSPVQDSQVENENKAVTIHPSAAFSYRLYSAGSWLFSLILLSSLMLLSALWVKAPVFAITLPLFFVPFCTYGLGFCWQMKEEIKQASKTIATVPGSRVLASLQWRRHGKLVLTVQDASSNKLRQYDVRREQKYDKLLQAAADGTQKEFRACINHDTGRPVALIIADCVCLLTERSQLKIFLQFHPLATYIRRIAAAIVDALILSLPFSLAFVFAVPLSSLIGLGLKPDIVSCLALALMLTSICDSLLPFTAPILLLMAVFNPTPGELQWLRQSVIVAMSVIFLLHLLYNSLWESSALRATPGKFIFKLFVTTNSGKTLSKLQALLRHMMRPLSWLIIAVLAAVLTFIPWVFVSAVGPTGPSSGLDPVGFFAGLFLAAAFVPFIASLQTRKEQTVHDLWSWSRVQRSTSSVAPTRAASVLLVLTIIMACLLNPIEYFKSHVHFEDWLSLMTHTVDTEIAKNPNNIKARWERAALYSTGLHAPLKAVEDYETILKSEPNNFYALTQAAECYTELGKYDRALALLDSAIKIKPTADAFYARALLSLYRGLPAQAIDDFNKMAKLKTGAQDDERRVILQTVAYRACGNENAANKLIAEAAKRSHASKDPNPILFYLNREPDAISLLMAATKSDFSGTKLAEVRCIIGLDLAACGKKAEALSVLREVKSSSSSNPYTYCYQLAMVTLNRLESEAKVQH